MEHNISSLHSSGDKITSTPIAKKRGRVENSSQDIEISSIQKLGSVDCSREEETPIETVCKRKRVRRKDYEIFKPKIQGTVYYQLFQKTVKTKFVARETLSKFEANKSEGTISMIQLMVDLAGFLEFNVTNFIKQEDDMKQSLTNIITQLIKCRNSYEGEICIFGRKSNFAKEFNNIVFQFLKCLVDLSEAREQLSSVFGPVILFCKLFCKSKRRVLTVTSVVIATKLCTEFILRKNEVEAKISFFSGSRYLTIDEETVDILKYHIKQLLNLHQKYSWLPDIALTNAKCISLVEMCTWIRINPAEYITNESFQLLAKLSGDYNGVIRRKALETCLYIVKTKSYVQYGNVYIHILLKTMKERIFDEDSITKALAIKLFSYCIKRYPNAVPYDDSIHQIFLRNLYCKDYNVAMQCANFFVIHFEQNDIDELEGILRIHKSSVKPNVGNDIAILVESFIEISKAISDLPRLLSVIVGVDFEISDKQVFAEILYHVVHVLLTLTTVSNRTGVNIRVDLDKSCDFVVNSVVPNMQKLLSVYENNIIGQKWILKTIVMINYADVEYTRLKEYIAEAVEYIIKEIIDKSQDPTLLSLSFAMLHKLSQNNFPFRAETIPDFNNYIDSIINSYKKNVRRCQVKDVGAESIAIITKQLPIISLISEIYELQIIDKLEWKHINFWEMEHLIVPYPKISAYQITTATWFIIWELRRLLEEENCNNIVKANQLNDKILMFIKNLFGALNNYTKNNILNVAICESISDLCVHFHQLKSNNNLNPIFNIINFKLGLVVKDCHKMIEFITHYCFEDRNDNNLESKQKLLWKFIYLLFSDDFITAEFFLNIWHILKYYKVFLKKYGKSLHTLIKKLKTKGAVPFLSILVHTLLKMYRTEFSADLKEVIKEFSFIIPTTNYLRVISMIISTIMNNENYIPLLEYFIPFTYKMDQSNKLLLISYINSLPETIKKQEPIINFINNLAGIERTTSRDSSSSSTTS